MNIINARRSQLPLVYTTFIVVATLAALLYTLSTNNHVGYKLRVQLAVLTQYIYSYLVSK